MKPETVDKWEAIGRALVAYRGTVQDFAVSRGYTVKTMSYRLLLAQRAGAMCPRLIQRGGQWVILDCVEDRYAENERAAADRRVDLADDLDVYAPRYRTSVCVADIVQWPLELVDALRRGLGLPVSMTDEQAADLAARFEVAP